MIIVHPKFSTVVNMRRIVELGEAKLKGYLLGFGEACEVECKCRMCFQKALDRLVRVSEEAAYGYTSLSYCNISDELQTHTVSNKAELS